MLGAYLGALGMSLEAIAYMTTRAANDMEWLTPYTAEKLGISIKMTEHEKIPEDIGPHVGRKASTRAGA
jgi:hypothetical protein